MELTQCIRLYIMISSCNNIKNITNYNPEDLIRMENKRPSENNKIK